MKNNLEVYKKINIDEVDINQIPNIDEIVISRKKDINDRITEYLINYNNPYFYNINGKIIKIEFSENENKAEDCITKVLSELYK